MLTTELTKLIFSEIKRSHEPADLVDILTAVRVLNYVLLTCNLGQVETACLITAIGELSDLALEEVAGVMPIDPKDMQQNLFGKLPF